MGPVTWKISEKSEMAGYFPGAAGRKMCVRIGPLGVAMSENSWSMIVMARRT
jgi:hypothetical protein